MGKLHTPREVLANVISSPRKPWWATRLMARIEQHLTDAQFQGKPVIDTPMSMLAVEAVLEEALEVVRMPGNDPIDDMMRDMHDETMRKTYVFGSLIDKPAGNA